MAAPQILPRVTDEPSTAALVRAAREGDRDAFAVLYERHRRFANALLLSYAPPDDVPDLLQEVFLTAWTQLSNLRETSAFPGWLGAIARNVGRMSVRARREHVSLTSDIQSHEAPPDAVLDAARALALISTLPAHLREPLLLRLVEGMDGEEIAVNLDMSHAAVRVNLHRGMKRLRELMEKHDD